MPGMAGNLDTSPIRRWGMLLDDFILYYFLHYGCETKNPVRAAVLKGRSMVRQLFLHFPSSSNEKFKNTTR